MPISNAMRAALRALSYPEPDIRKTYPLERRVKLLASKMGTLQPNGCYSIDSAFCHSHHTIPLRIYFPANSKEEVVHQNPVLLFFHGGGWVMGCIESYDSVCRRLARLTGLIVVSTQYRLAPEHPYPAAVEDCFSVAQALSEGRILPGVGPEQVTLIGDSAGGNLAAAVSLMARDRLELFPAAQILIYPALYNQYGPDSPYPSVQENGTDYLLTAKRLSEFVQLYQGENKTAASQCYFAPLLAKDLSRQPPTLIITAEYCPLRDEGEDYGKKLQKAGVSATVCRIPDALHNFFMLTENFGAVRRTHEQIQRFLGQIYPQQQYPALPWEIPQAAETPASPQNRTVLHRTSFSQIEEQLRRHWKHNSPK